MGRLAGFMTGDLFGFLTDLGNTEGTQVRKPCLREKCSANMHYSEV